ncbi:MAG: HelD family protein, partial [Acidimicrobiales bacterium]
MATHPDLEAEQAYLDHAHDRLEAMRRGAREMLASVLDAGKGGTHQAREERDVIVRSGLQRLEQLDIGNRSLCFGRIDRAPESPGDASAGETFHVGRLAVSDEDLEPLVVDWRAPVAEPFYRATGRDPMGLTRRRHFATEGRRLLGVEDELFGLSRARLGVGSEATLKGDADDGLVASGALLSALERSRSTHMTDIVATVQREQDEIIRAPLSGVLVVQGGPGTGKTAVALHRAAYLLYTHRFPLERQGVLVVGPNQVFLSYIEQVLPSLGESGVSLTTVNGLVPVSARSSEPPTTAALKGEARMAQILAKAVRDRERPLRKEGRVPFGATVLTLSVRESSEIVRAARRRPGTHNARRRYVESRLL